MKKILILFTLSLFILSCAKKQADRKSTHYPEPDVSDITFKSDDDKKEAKKEELKEVVNKTPAEAFNNTSKEVVKTPKKVAVKKSKKEIIKKTPKVVAKKKISVDTSGLIYTVQIAAVDHKSKKYSTINNVITYNENSLVKYSLGAFKTLKEANKYRKQINKKYKGAFVKALKNNVPVSIK
jgi:hypothetical protein